MVKTQQLVGGLTSLFSSKDVQVLPCPSTSSSSSSFAWQWPSCAQPRTLSFRQEQEQQHQTTMKQAYKTMNSVDSFSMADQDAAVDGSLFSEEAIVRALRSDRLFFEPGDDASSCIIKHKQAAATSDEPSNKLKESASVAFGGATAMSVESRNPYRDFLESMEAMVMSHGGVVKDWRWLEEMLGWYLRANGKSTHGLIVGAFVDLLVSLSDTSPSSSSPATPTTNASASACSSSSSLCNVPPFDLI